MRENSDLDLFMEHGDDYRNFTAIVTKVATDLFDAASTPAKQRKAPTANPKAKAKSKRKAKSKIKVDIPKRRLNPADAQKEYDRALKALHYARERYKRAARRIANYKRKGML